MAVLAWHREDVTTDLVEFSFREMYDFCQRFWTLNPKTSMMGQEHLLMILVNDQVSQLH